jgi:hypothetical protein
VTVVALVLGQGWYQLGMEVVHAALSLAVGWVLWEVTSHRR